MQFLCRVKKKEKCVALRFSGNVISTCYRALVSKISQVEDSKEPKFGNMFPAFSGNISCGISNKLRQIYIYWWGAQKDMLFLSIKCGAI